MIVTIDFQWVLMVVGIVVVVISFVKFLASYELKRRDSDDDIDWKSKSGWDD
jgi:hypothetical protein